MVAAQRDPDARSPALRAARRQLAALLGTAHVATSDAAPPIAAWKAWLFTIWCCFVCAAYAWTLYRSFN